MIKLIHAQLNDRFTRNLKWNKIKTAYAYYEHDGCLGAPVFRISVRVFRRNIT